MSLGEFVKQLAVLMDNNDLVMLFKEETPWHVLFYRLKKDAALGKPDFFRTLRFDWDGPHPKCQELSRFIQTLHWTGAVGAVNPSYEKIVLKPEVSKVWADMANELEDDLKQFLQRAADLAKEEFPAENSVMN
jgi:hypothetical protein